MSEAKRKAGGGWKGLPVSPSQGLENVKSQGLSFGQRISARGRIRAGVLGMQGRRIANSGVQLSPRIAAQVE